MDGSITYTKQVVDNIANTRLSYHYAYAGGNGTTIKLGIGRDACCLLILFNIWNGTSSLYNVWASNDMAGVQCIGGSSVIPEGIYLYNQGSGSELSIAIPAGYCYNVIARS